jgi:hypothetical protein
MTCRYCGREIQDGAKFCPFCGAANKEFQAEIGPEAPEEKPKIGLFIAIGAAVIVVAALALVLFGGLFSNPKGQVEKAAAKTAAAYAQAEKAMGLPDLSYMSREQSYSQRFALALNSINSDMVGYDMDALSGLGMSLDANLDGKGRQLDFALSLFWGEEDLLTLLVAAQDAALYFYSPQITGEVSYGVDTETLGADLAARRGVDMEDVSFNIFDLIDGALTEMDPEGLEQSLKEANRALWEDAKVKKLGSRALDVNRTSTKTKAYQVTFSEEALSQYVDRLEGVLSAMNYFSLYEEMLQSTGMPQAEIDSFMDALNELDVYGAMADSLRDLIEVTGELELEVCLSGGYVSAVFYEGEILGSELEVELYLGGGEEYVDDLSVEMRVEDIKTTLKSSGDHGGKSGAFTDKTTIRSDAFGVFVPSIVSEFRYEPKKTADNLSWELSIPNAGSLDMAGTLTAGQDSISMVLDDVAVKVMGMEVCSLGLEYYAGPFQGAAIPDAEVKIITQMSEEELMDMVLATQRNALAWSNKMEALFLTRLPEDLYWAMMY